MIVWYAEKVGNYQFLTEHRITYINGMNKNLGLTFRMNPISITDPALHTSKKSAENYLKRL